MKLRMKKIKKGWNIFYALLLFFSSVILCKEQCAVFPVFTVSQTCIITKKALSIDAYNAYELKC